MLQDSGFFSVWFFLDFIFMLLHHKCNFDFCLITYITDFIYSDNSHVSVTKYIFPSEESRGQMLFLGAPQAARLEANAFGSPGPSWPGRPLLDCGLQLSPWEPLLQTFSF